jgi:hypothetical protein
MHHGLLSSLSSRPLVRSQLMALPAVIWSKL